MMNATAMAEILFLLRLRLFPPLLPHHAPP